MKHLRNCKNYSIRDTEKQDYEAQTPSKALEATLRNWTLFQNIIVTEADLFEEHRCTFTKVYQPTSHNNVGKMIKKGKV